MSQQSGVDRGGGGHGGGGHGGGGHGHGGGGGGHGGGGHGERHWGTHHGEGGGRGGGEWSDADGPWGNAAWELEEPPPMPIESCSWGESVSMTADLATVGRQAFEQSGTYPAHGYVNGMLYRFTIQNGMITAQPCVGLGVGDDGGILPFLPAGLTRALGLPPPEAGRLLNVLGYAATLMGVRTFQVGQNLPDTGIVDDATMNALRLLANAAGLGDPPPPQPTGTPIYEAVSAAGNAAAELFRAASREFEREIASMKASGVGEPWSPDPTGKSVKSLETPGYLRDPGAAFP